MNLSLRVKNQDINMQTIKALLDIIKANQGVAQPLNLKMNLTGIVYNTAEQQIYIDIDIQLP